MNVIWLEQADVALHKTADYIASEFGQASRDKFMREVDRTGIFLGDNPYLGPVERLLAERPATYRSIVVANLNKIVYRILDDRIEIVDFWDCRREPKALAHQVK